MGGKRIAGIVCFLLAAGLFVSGVSTVMRGPDISDASGVGVSHAVGAFLPSIVTLIVALKLFNHTAQ